MTVGPNVPARVASTDAETRVMYNGRKNPERRSAMTTDAPLPDDEPERAPPLPSREFDDDEDEGSESLTDDGPDPELDSNI
jgi:hypothetical protein